MSSDPVQRVPYAVSPPRYSVSHQMVTTAFELPNYRLVQNLGVVRGIVVRSRNVFATLGATIQTIVGGNITLWSKLCEQTRSDAFDIMIKQVADIVCYSRTWKSLHFNYDINFIEYPATVANCK